MTRFFGSVLIILTIGAATAARSQDETVTVFAAASMMDALDHVDHTFTTRTGIKVVTSYDASSVLIKQIEGGAPADAFVSADTKWMDYGVEKKVINESTRINLFGNVLVLIAAKDSKIDHVDIKPGFDLAKLAGDGRIATGDVRAVPAGLYAKAALEKLGVWPSVEPKMAMTVNVRAALAYVARSEAPLGIVYATDAKIEPRVKVVGVFPDDSHDPIIYPVAATVNAKPETMRYLAFLRSATTKAFFEGYGFSVLLKPHILSQRTEMATKRKIEVFSAGCALCHEVIDVVRLEVGSSSQVIVHDMMDARVLARAEKFGIRSVPAVVIDGKLASCCTGRGVDLQVLKNELEK